MKQKAKNENKSNNIRHLAAAVATSGLLLTILTACVSQPRPPAPPVDVTIEITFLPKSATDPTLCADSVDPNDPAVFTDKFVTWQAVDSNGGNINQGFEIYFDPIQGAPLLAPSGMLKKKIDTDAPKVQYKYTIWDRVTGGNPHVCDPLDPHFRVYYADPVASAGPGWCDLRHSRSTHREALQAV